MENRLKEISYIEYEYRTLVENTEILVIFHLNSNGLICKIESMKKGTMQITENKISETRMMKTYERIFELILSEKNKDDSFGLVRIHLNNGRILRKAKLLDVSFLGLV